MPLRADDRTLGRSLRLAARPDPHRAVVVGVHGADRLRLEVLLATAAGVAVNGFMLLLLIRFLLAAAKQGVAKRPRVISSWFPPGKRGPPQALISTSAQIGGATAPHWPLISSNRRTSAGAGPS